MKRKNSFSCYHFLLGLLMSIGPSPLLGQSLDLCPVVYDVVEEMPIYKKGKADLLNYIFEELTPIIAQCNKEENHLITSLYFSLVILDNGSVGEVAFKRIAASDACKARVREKLMSMKGWKAGKIDGVNVCARYSVPIQCLKWD